VTLNWRSGHINTDPLFVNTGLNDFHLQSSSPCINTGDTTGISGIPLVDLDSNNRFYGMIDMGCYEFQSSPSDINSLSVYNQIQVYPNPATDFIIFENESGKDIEIILYNLSGSVVCSRTIRGGKTILKMPVSNLPDGVYFLRWTNEQMIGDKKIIVAH
jgi:hypothetical protein